MLLLLAVGVGIYLGLHFNILVLAPFCTLGAGAYLVSSASADHGIVQCLGDLIWPFTAIQMGFFLGLLGREPVAAVLARLNLRRSKRA
jgi:hypothetical protein